MKPSCILLIGALLLTSCDSLKRGEYTPLYLQEPSPLDPPGTEAIREKMRAERVKEGIFEVGATPEVHQGKVFLLDRNPDFTPDPVGRMVESEKVKVLSCEGMYYFVEAEGGERGFVRETDMVNPVKLVPTAEFLPMPTTGEGILPDGTQAVLPLEPAPIAADGRQLHLNEDGRTVVLVGKNSEKNSQFEARKRALESGQSLDGSESVVPASGAYDEGDDALPEPSGSANR
ncbi:MAG: hypothetical protein Q4F38_05040 [Akkermansia sp.]|nr:hypothetical protein [Akkermansia sp.]